MKRVKFFSNYCSDKQIYDNFFSCFKLDRSNNYGIKYVLTHGDDYTHAVIINTAMPVIKDGVPKENVIGVAYEPPVFLNASQEFVNYARKYISKYFIGSNNGLPPDLFIEKYSYMFYDSSLMSSIKPKSKVMSIIFSNKTVEVGHSYRHQLVREIIKYTNFPVDVYGIGCRYYTHLKDARFKGEFHGSEPYSEYLFHITIENVSIPEYFSEKILNALVSMTVPIYWGCKNIDNYFPGQMYKLSGVLADDMKLIFEICKNPMAYYNKIKIDVNEIKRKVDVENLILEM